MDLPLSVKEFLNDFYEGKISQVETYRYIEKFTEKFRKDLLNLFLEDIEETIYFRKREIIAEYQGLVPLLIKNYKKAGKEVPYIIDSLGKKQISEEAILRDTILSFLFTLNELKAQVEELIEKNGPQQKHQNQLITTVCDFSFYLTPEGQKLIPELQGRYNNGPKKDFAIMVLALKNLGLIIKYNFISGHKKLNEALQITFKGVGSRQHLTTNIELYKLPVGPLKEEFQAHLKDISEMLQKIRTQPPQELENS